MLAYQVCEWTRSTLPEAAVIDRSTDKVARAGFAYATAAAGRCPDAPGRSAPKARTSTSISLRNSRAR